MKLCRAQRIKRSKQTSGAKSPVETQEAAVSVRGDGAAHPLSHWLLGGAVITESQHKEQGSVTERHCSRGQKVLKQRESEK